ILLPLFSIGQVLVSGSVVDQNNNPLSGVTVRHLNSNVSASTDAGGRFSLSLPDKTGNIEFTSVGFIKQTVPASQVVPGFVLKLQEDASKMEEVVVTGLATSVKRSNLGNAVSS